jgi:hypothetical protein
MIRAKIKKKEIRSLRGLFLLTFSACFNKLECNVGRKTNSL